MHVKKKVKLHTPTVIHGWRWSWRLCGGGCSRACSGIVKRLIWETLGLSSLQSKRRFYGFIKTTKMLNIRHVQMNTKWVQIQKCWKSSPSYHTNLLFIKSNLLYPETKSLQPRISTPLSLLVKSTHAKIEYIHSVDMCDCPFVLCKKGEAKWFQSPICRYSHQTIFHMFDQMLHTTSNPKTKSH